MANVTIRDVAQEAGLSISSVSRILRGGQGHVYPQETQDRVREAAQRLGYRANVAARILSQNARTMIGVAVHFTEHPYLNRFLVAVHQELLRHEYDPVYLDAVHLASDDSAQPFPPPHMLAGLISLGVDLQYGWPSHYAALREHLPIVAVQPVSPVAAEWVDVVQPDFEKAFGAALDHLLGLGHRHIAYLGVLDRPNSSDLCKNEGWCQAAQARNLPSTHCLNWEVYSPRVWPMPATQPDFIYQKESAEAMTRIVEQLQALPDKVTALMVAGDEIAIAFQSCLQARGWQLPRDFSIVGYDGISLGDYVHPALTTITPDYARTAEVAVERLMELMGRTGRRRHGAKAGGAALEKPPAGEESSLPRVTLKVEPRLIVRASTAARPTAGPQA